MTDGGKSVERGCGDKGERYGDAGVSFIPLMSLFLRKKLHLKLISELMLVSVSLWFNWVVS
jgi:hypothetical protein